MQRPLSKEKFLFVANRALIALAVAAILVGLYFDEWGAVLNNARILCFSCIGLE
jgi:hypothetical protein